MKMETLMERMEDFRIQWCRSQKSDRDLEMFVHMCYVVGVEPQVFLMQHKPEPTHKPDKE